jgi:hypothetical protein
MMNSYRLSDGVELRWGFDQSAGFFVQLFDVRDELILNADQGKALFEDDYPVEYITLGPMLGTLERYCLEAFNDFRSLLSRQLNDTLYGYAYNADGKHSGKVPLSTYKDLFLFLDSLRSSAGFMLTDGLDYAVDIRDIANRIPNKSMI